MARQYKSFQIGTPGFSYAGFNAAQEGFQQIADNITDYVDQAREVTLQNHENNKARNTQDIIRQAMENTGTSGELKSILSGLRDSNSGPVDDEALNTFFNDHTNRLRDQENEAAALAIDLRNADRQDAQFKLNEGNVESQIDLREQQLKALQDEETAFTEFREGMDYLTGLGSKFQAGQRYNEEGQFREELRFNTDGSVDFTEAGQAILDRAENLVDGPKFTELEQAMLNALEVNPNMPIPTTLQQKIATVDEIDTANDAYMAAAERLREEAATLAFSEQERIDFSPAGQTQYLVKAAARTRGSFNSLAGSNFFDALSSPLETPAQRAAREANEASQERRNEIADFTTKEQIKFQYDSLLAKQKSKRKSSGNVIDMIDDSLKKARNMPGWDSAYEQDLVEYYAKDRKEIQEDFGLPVEPTDKQISQLIDYFVVRSGDENRAPFFLPTFFFDSEFHPTNDADAVKFFRSLVTLSADSDQKSDISAANIQQTLDQLRNINTR